MPDCLVLRSSAPFQATCNSIPTTLSRWRQSGRIALAKETEAAAFAADPRIVNSEGASFSAYSGQRVFANSLGFIGTYRSSSCSLGVTPVARQNPNGPMERDYWSSSARRFADLESPDAIGRRAAERALRRLGARKIPTQRAPVVFEPRTARSLLEHIFDAVEGEAIYRDASFLAGRLGEKIASERVNLIDDGTIPGLFGTSPFDDEGVPTRRTAVIQRGVLKSLADEHLRGAQARPLDHRQRRSRDHRQCRHRA